MKITEVEEKLGIDDYAERKNTSLTTETLLKTIQQHHYTSETLHTILEGKFWQKVNVTAKNSVKNKYFFGKEHVLQVPDNIEKKEAIGRMKITSQHRKLPSRQHQSHQILTPET